MLTRMLLVIGAALFVLTTACAPDQATAPTATPPEPSAHQPVGATVRPVSAASTEPSDGFPSGLTKATVTRVVDGDTIEVDIAGQTFKVRYIGIDTPETVDPRRPVQCFGKEASERNRQLVEGRTVGLEKDVSETDAFGRLLRYVWSGDLMVNSALVEEGFAHASTYPPDVKYAALFAALQVQARDAGRGLWGAPCGTLEPTPAAEGVCDYSGTAQPVIKGNISQSSGEKIYHVPGGRYYDDTMIDETRGERWFCSEAEALAAGWRRSTQ